MNQEVVKELKIKLDANFKSEIKELKERLAKMMVTGGNICTDVTCLNEIDDMIKTTNNFMATLAKYHGINPHDLIEEVLKVMLKGNDYARKLHTTAEAFKDDRFVGFC